MVTSQFFFMFFSNFSGNTLYESYFLVMYNTLYSSIPVMVYAILEQNIPAYKLIQDPKLYTMNSKNSLMSYRCLIKWTFSALWHSLVTFFVCYLVYTDSETDLWSLQTAVAQIIVVVVNFKLLLVSKSWNMLLIISVIFSIISFTVLTTILQTVFSHDNFLVDSSYYMVYVNLLYQSKFWASTILALIISLIPDLLILVVENVQIKYKPKYNTTVPFLEPVI